MKQLRVILLAALLLVCLLTAAGCVAEPKQVPSTGEKYIVGIDDFAPWTYKDEKGTITGFDIEAAQWVAKNQGFDLEFRMIEWNNLTALLNDGTIDIVWSGLSITPDRQDKIAYTDPYWNEPIGAAARKDAGIRLSDLYTGIYTTGIQNGSTSDQRLPEYLGKEMYQEMLAAGKIKNTYPIITDAMKDLSAGKIDIVVFDMDGINDYLKTDKTLEYLGDVDKTGEQYAAAVKSGNTALLEKLNKGISALKKSGDFQYMQIKYGFARNIANTH